MNNALISFILILALLFPIASTPLQVYALTEKDAQITANEEEVYRNPITVENQPQESADPFVMKYNGIYYLYVTGGNVYSSEDMVNWKSEGNCLRGAERSNSAYAPEVKYWNGKFYLYSATSHSGDRKQRTFISTSPTGPFDYAGETYEENSSNIDGSVYIDDDDAATKYFTQTSGSCIEYKKLNDNMLTAGSSTKISQATLSNKWTEGPYIFKRKGVYYMTYTGNHYLADNYRVEYVAGRSINAFKKPEDNLILCNTEEDTTRGLGHNSIVTGPDLDTLYIVYHNLLSTRCERLMNIDRLVFNGEKLIVQGPTWWDVSAPKMPNFYDRMANSDNWDIQGTSSISGGFLTLQGNAIALSKTSTPADYTAEFNLKNTSGEDAKAGVLVSYTDNNNYAYAYINPTDKTLYFETVINGTKTTKTRILPSEYTYTGTEIRKINVKKQGSTFDVYVDDRLLISQTAEGLGAGKIGFKTENCTASYGYTAYSDTVNGNQDKATVKPTGSEMAAALANDTSRDFTWGTYTDSKAGITSEYIKDMTVGDSVTFNINPETTSYYSADIKAKNAADAKISLYVDNQLVKENVTISASDKFIKTAVRNVKLDKTSQTIKLVVTEGTLDLYSVTLAKLDDVYDATVTQDEMALEWIDGQWTESGDTITANTLNSYGTAGYGREYTGDYEASADITLKSGSDAGFMMRLKYAVCVSDKTSGIDGCLDADYHYGYYAFIKSGSVMLGKQMFDWNVLASKNADISYNKSYNLKVVVKGANIKVYLDGALMIDYTDINEPIMEGRFGLRAYNSNADYKNITLTHIDPPQTPANPRQTIDSDATPITKNNVKIYSHTSGKGDSAGKGYWIDNGGITFNESRKSIKGYFPDVQLVNGTVSCDITLPAYGNFQIGLVLRALRAPFGSGIDDLDGLAVQLERGIDSTLSLKVQSWQNKEWKGALSTVTKNNYFNTKDPKTVNLKAVLKDDKLDVYLDNVLEMQDVSISNWGTLMSRCNIGFRSHLSAPVTLTNFKYTVADVANPVYPDKVESVTASPESGTLLTPGSKVTLRTATSGAAIKYSLDDGATWQNYTSAITLQSFPAKIRAYAVKDDMLNSDESVFEYPEKAAAAPVKATPDSGEVTLGTKVTLSCETPDAIIKYSMDGGASWQTYTSPITLNTLPATILAYAQGDNLLNSPQSRFTYTLKTVEIKHKVTFKYGNSVISSKTVSDKKKVLAPNAPKKKNKTFIGWYADSKFKTKFNFSKAITKDTVVYAYYVQNPAKPSKIKLKKLGNSKVQVSWKKVKGVTYQITVSTQKNKGYGKAVSVKNAKYIKKGLKSGKTYYFKVRCFKVVKGKKVYSNYSTPKKITLK